MKLVSCEINDEENCNTTCDVIKFLIEKGANINYRNEDNQNVFNTLKNNNKIAPKYKQEIYSLLNNSYNSNILNSQNHLKNLRNNLFKNDKDEMILQTIDDNSSSCCFIF